MKVLLIFTILFTFTFSFANIFIEGPYAWELQWIDGEWNMELLNLYVYPPVLSECYMSAYNGYSYFNGNSFPFDEFTIVTKNDLQVPLEINPEGDEIILGWAGQSSAIPSCHVYFGNSGYNMAPLQGESLVRKPFADPNYPLVGYYYCRDNTPTMGVVNDDSGFTGTFCGTVFNQQNEPLERVLLEYFPPLNANQIYTDISGAFTLEMNTVRYDIQVIYDNVTYIDTMISIAPDSTTMKNFVLPVVSTIPTTIDYNTAELHNYPNPFYISNSSAQERKSDSFRATNIQYKIPQNIKSASIEIFNSKGQLVRSFECSISSPETLQQVKWNGADNDGHLVSSGVYYAQLIGNGKFLTKCKILLLK